MIPPEWLDKVVAGGPSLIFAVLWYLERGERRDAQAELKTITERVLLAMSETKSALVTFGSILNPTGRG
jgi:hypothetical protein